MPWYTSGDIHGKDPAPFVFVRAAVVLEKVSVREKGDVVRDRYISI